MTSFSSLVLAAAFGLSSVHGSQFSATNGKCPANAQATSCSTPRPPSTSTMTATKCWRANDNVRFQPNASASGMKVQAKSSADGSVITMASTTTAGQGAVKFESFCSNAACVKDTGYEQKFFKKLRKGLFSIRFVDQSGKAGAWFECFRNTPIAFDLDQSEHVEKITGEWEVDMDADGELELINEWFAPTEGILLDGRAPLGEKVNGEYLFGDQGNKYEHGYEKLSLHHDFNNDRAVSGSEMMGLKIWVDANSDAIVDAGEVYELSAFGIAAISVDQDNLVSEALLVDGTTMMSEDLVFAR